MPALLQNELEFFIETNQLVSAERALDIGESLLVFLRQETVLGPDAEIRLSHLGQGSLVARVMAVLRDPATATMVALAAAAISGVALLESGESDERNGHFPEKVAEACIEADARRCGFRVGSDEFYIERDAMPAIREVEEKQRRGAPVQLPPAGYAYVLDGSAYAKDGPNYIIAPIAPTRRGYVGETVGEGSLGGDPDREDHASPAFETDAAIEPDYLETEDGEIITDESGTPIEIGSAPEVPRAESYAPPEFTVVGIFDYEDNVPSVRTTERAYELDVREGDSLPLTDQVCDFTLRGPLTSYGSEYSLVGWANRDEGPARKLMGRMVERHGGRAVTFESNDQTYAPVVPDDTLDWVPMGALVEAKAAVMPDGMLAIFAWQEIADPDISPPGREKSAIAQSSIKNVSTFDPPMPQGAVPFTESDINFPGAVHKVVGTFHTDEQGIEYFLAGNKYGEIFAPDDVIGARGKVFAEIRIETDEKGKVWIAIDSTEEVEEF